MKHHFVLPLLLLALLWGVSTPAHAATSDGVTLVPDSLSLVRTIPGDSVAASMRLNVSQPITNVTLLVSDLQGVGHDGQLLDPIPATNINILPALQFNSLAANSITQLTLQLAPPAVVGIYTGTLLIRWEAPALSELTVPIRLQLRTKPELVVHEPADATGLQIYATQGSWIGSVVMERHLTLREKSGGATISDLRALPSDLLDAANRQTLSGNILTVDLAATAIEPGELLTATLGVDLANAPAGDFKGSLTLVAKPDILLTVPVEIQVRHHWLLPLIVLSVGVLLGLSLSSYQSRGRLRDEFVVRMSNVREALKEDNDLKKGFGTRLEQLLVEVDVAVRTARWREAESQMAEAERLLVKWRKEAEDWRNQLNYLRTQVLKRVQDKLATYHDPTLVPQTLRKLRQDAEDLQQSAVDLASPAELRGKIVAIEETLHAFEQVEELFAALVELRKEFDSTKVDAALFATWLNAEQALRIKLTTLALDNDGLNGLASEIAAQKQVLTQYQQDHPDHLVLHPAAAAEAMPDGGEGEEPSVYLPGISASRDYNPQKARWRLGQNAWLLYILSAIVLVSVGMSTLYATNATFGANTLSDYFSMFIFGLGAQTTVASATDLLQRWGMPFGRQH